MEFFILALPVFTFIWLVISIIKFCRTNKENFERRRSLKRRIIISAVITAAWFVTVGGFLLLIIYSITVNGM